MPSATTKAAEGYSRRAFTVDEIIAMQDAGIISEDENFELIEGEIVPPRRQVFRPRTNEISNCNDALSRLPG